MTFEFSMGVKKGNEALKKQLEEALDRRQTEIAQILNDYGRAPSRPAGWLAGKPQP